MSDRNAPTSIELAPNSVATVTPSLVFSNRLTLRFSNTDAWASYCLELTPDQARQLAAALLAQADTLQAVNDNNNKG